MNEKCIHTLEFDKIRLRLEGKAGTEEGRRLCRELMPSADIEEVRRLQRETTDACDLVRLKGGFSFGGVKNILPSLMRLEIGGALSAEELLALSRLLEIGLRASQYGARGQESPETSLTPLFDGLSPLESLQKEIARCVLSEDEIADDASSELKRIRRGLSGAQARVHAELQSVLNRSQEYLMDSVVVMRDGRYCLPVKSEYKNRFPGMVHDQSASGSTCFIEPLSVLKLNNEIRELEIAEQKEILAVLAALSAQAAEHIPELRTNYKSLTALDFIFARAALSREMKGSEPVYSADRHFVLKAARHPLLPPHSVVPIDLRLGSDFDLLIITGPNTGGKTVALKTAGLLTLMGQAGLHIPAFPGSELSVFTEVWADIGDEQSIEQSLSTFSSHMTRIVEILEKADENSLVLFDELGAGTDPTEGAALAMSILSYLHRLGIRTVATTHYSELKLFALETEGVTNGSCEFDVETLRPTYRLLIGLPGKSNAFAISERLGLPSHLIEDAKAYIGQQDEAFEDVLRGLDASRRALEKEKEDAERLRREAQDLRASYEAKSRKLEAEKDRILAAAREEAAKNLREAKEYTDSMISRITMASKDAGLNRMLEQERKALREKLDKASGPAKEKKAPAKVRDPKDFHIGDGVRVLSMNLNGVVTGKPDGKGMVPVKMGILNSMVAASDLELLSEDTFTLEGSSASVKKDKGSLSGIRMNKSLTVSPEINLIGMTVDQALPALEKYLDDAYLAHLEKVRVVHGRGTGALRSAVHRHLKKLRYVAEYHLGAYGEGDTGVTIVTFEGGQKP